MKRVWLIAMGLFIAFLGQFIALGLAGAGHGWITPFWASISFWVLYPLVLARSPGPRSVAIDATTVLLALIADGLLIVQTFREGVEYFWKVVEFDGWLFVGAWLAIWLAWQAVAAANLAKKPTVAA
jgi:hypothetical protein